MKILAAAEMREVDRLTNERFHIPSLTLMENAGTGVADFACRRFADLAKRRVIVLCGKGNNGGDGLVAARVLHDRGVSPRVILCGAPEEMRGDAATNLERYRSAGRELRLARNPSEWEAQRDSLAKAHVILDALLGTGLRGPVEGFLAQVIEYVNGIVKNDESRAYVIAVDIPSGISSDTGEVLGTAISAQATVTFTAPKIGQIKAPGADHAGQLIVVNIGSPPELIEECSVSTLRWLEPSEFTRLRFRRPYATNTNKGSYGHALIVAGSRGKTGAATMAGWAALRSGAGLVTVGTPETEVATVGARVPEMMVAPVAATAAGTIARSALSSGQLEELQKGKTVLAMGPGLTTNPETVEVVHNILRDTALPMVLDADGLNAFAGRGDTLKQHAAKSMVVTPHPGEMARLVGCAVPEVQRDRIGVAKHAASNWNSHVVLKGHETVIASPSGTVWINSTGNPGMSTAGTGDVLTGMLAGFAAQFEKRGWDDTVCVAVYLHGLAGDIAVAKTGEPSLMATDVIEAIPSAFAQIISEIERVHS